MVIICSEPYETASIVNEEQKIQMKEHFSTFPFELSDFQKYALTSIVQGDHVLITAHTGSGKTLPAEFAIKFFCSQGKKVIYTSPIKALSNQKFHEFSKQFPEFSIGILTGDIKFNPEADVLIMTTEILQNNLYQRSQNIETENLHFNINIETELGCVVYDEVHYINDAARGNVWEESMMMLPVHVQMVMLSATIDKAHVFAKWCEDRHDDSQLNKKVWLAPTNNRVVPLTHYNYVVTPDGFYKHEKDKEIQKRVREYCGDFHVIRDSKGNFIEETAHKTRKILELLEKHRVRVNNDFVIESVLRFLNQRDMLPAIFFVFSRKNVERFAKNISISLFPDDSKIPSIIENECTTILRKLPNHEEYIKLPEFKFIITCLQKGIAVHHSGIIPVFREMIEMLFAKGYIRALFATETFAVGINMPTRTVVFTALNKFSEKGNRWVYSHEYTQMAGRAGRRGIDTVGHVIHLNNMMWGSEYIDTTTYRKILSGVPQTLTSKFTVNFGIILNMIEMGIDYSELETYSRKSMLNGEIECMTSGINSEINEVIKTLSQYGFNECDEEQINEYIRLENSMENMNGNKRKKVMKTLSRLSGEISDFETKRKKFKDYSYKKNEFDDLIRARDNILLYFINTIRIKFDYLLSNKFIIFDSDTYKNTPKGKTSLLIREAPGLTMGDIFENNILHKLNCEEIVGFISCFTNIRVSEEIKKNIPPKSDNIISFELEQALEQMKIYMTTHSISQMSLGINDVSEDPDYDIHYDIIHETIQWCLCDNEKDCILLLNKLKDEKNIFPGEFVKSLLKINNIILEMQNVCEYLCNVELNYKLSQISEKLLKYIATNQSLYV
jgi:superfamily II RNA helicase